jgi:hypothetical protein
LDSFYDPVNMLSNLNATSRYSTGLSARLVVYEQMNSPQWTFGPYVLPKLTSTAEGIGSIDNVSSISVDLPVRRGALTCQTIPQDQLTLIYPGSQSNASGVDVNWPLLDQYSCTYSTLIADDKSVMKVTPRQDGPFGEWTYFVVDTSRRKKQCPTSVGLYGTWQNKRATQLNAVQCWSSVQILYASAQFSMPGWKLRSLQAHESSMRNVSATQDTQVDLDKDVFGGSKGNVSTSLDNVFTAFLHNSTTNTVDTRLVERENWNELYARINGVYGRATVSNHSIAPLIMRQDKPSQDHCDGSASRYHTNNN